MLLRIKGREFQNLIAVYKNDFKPKLLTLGVSHEREVTEGSRIRTVSETYNLIVVVSRQC